MGIEFIIITPMLIPTIPTPPMLIPTRPTHGESFSFLVFNPNLGKISILTNIRSSGNHHLDMYMCICMYAYTFI